TKPNSDISRIASHNLEQVLRLHMQAATIMAVLSEQSPKRKFSEHSIYRPVKEACELFASEAASKGCDILGPSAREGSFPPMEMSLFDLTIAFKNIIHNAVKYSFTPPANMSTHRTIKVWGEWDRSRKAYYVIHVQNYGVGITPEEIEKRLIFDRYYRGDKASDRRRTGSGLGLAHARLVIEELHHGEINVTSEPQGGDAYLTQFSVRLPIKQPGNI
ncbi:MAG: sensor histidine kinase, partial [Chloroflexi bacterium]